MNTLTRISIIAGVTAAAVALALTGSGGNTLYRNHPQATLYRNHPQIRAAAYEAVVGNHYSQFLSGYGVEGNGLQPYSDIRAETVNLPAESSSVPANSLAVGVAMGSDITGSGTVYGLGAVFDSTAGWA